MTFDDTQVDWLGELLAEAAAAEIMPRFRRLADGDIRQKTSAIDLVTEADVNAERYITARLRDRYPGAIVVGEEAHSEDASVLDGLEGAKLAFVIDPVDGTFNFAAGLPLFGVMLAVVVNGETVAGMIYDPVGVDMLMAVKGGGAVIRHSERTTVRCRVAPAASIPEMTGSVSWQYAPPADKVKLARNLAKFKAPFGYRCAAHEYRLLATGFGHFDVFMKVMPWDHLPGTLILQEAGGHVALIDGRPYRPGHVGGGLLCAPDAASWEEIRAALWAD